ncbi:MAG: hypothetical protein KGD66_04305 [Candidatus Lokiarchaeota archaeon]|nr:hypothetical protein [Candidatus Lokiarchaeota archaeon]
MLKSRKSKFKIFTILSIVGLLCLSPLVYNVRQFFELQAVKNQRIDGDVDVIVNINVKTYPDISLYYVIFDFISNETVTDVEVEGIHYDVYQNTNMIYTYNGNYTNYVISRSIELHYGDNLTYQGLVELNYQLNSNPQNDTVNFDLIYTHNIRDWDGLPFFVIKNLIYIAYIVSFLIVPIILFFIIHPDWLEPSVEEKEENEEYFKYLEKIKQENTN